MNLRISSGTFTYLISARIISNAMVIGDLGSLLNIHLVSYFDAFLYSNVISQALPQKL